MLRLKQLRTERQMSQQQLAQRLGVAQNTVSNWENGRRKVEPDMLVRLAQMFGVTADYLLGTEPADALSPKEKQLLDAFRSLTPEQQQILLTYAAADAADAAVQRRH